MSPNCPSKGTNRSQVDDSSKLLHAHLKEYVRLSKSPSEKDPIRCQTVINQPFPSGEEAHGCPFRHYDQENLAGQIVELTFLDSLQTQVKKVGHDLRCKVQSKSRVTR